MDWKNSLNLPKTDFPMKAKLPEREPQQLAAWEQAGIYRRILESRTDKPLFVLHDGPPYPTGEIHLGTGLNLVATFSIEDLLGCLESLLFWLKGLSVGLLVLLSLEIGFCLLGGGGGSFGVFEGNIVVGY